MAQYRTFQRAIAELTAQGYGLIWERGSEAQSRAAIKRRAVTTALFLLRRAPLARSSGDRARGKETSNA
jgi:hypothetical protein